ncbi:hypothetical protein HHK36_028536 [Tetracentron sinense]|uniref:RING-type domain-containing protein n=1 Tax=Tetracentron sinense TaxID=13715 RepID=A0A835D0K1_TETSI|nr:hypothetical protein HHK36_028536 [Tetracentron sinense]
MSFVQDVECSFLDAIVLRERDKINPSNDDTQVIFKFFIKPTYVYLEHLNDRDFHVHHVSHPSVKKVFSIHYLNLFLHENMQLSVLEMLLSLEFLEIETCEALVEEISSFAYQKGQTLWLQTNPAAIEITVEIQLMIEELSDDEEESEELDEETGVGTSVGASKKSIEGLETMKLERGESVEHCTVCLEDFLIGMDVTKMPCSHTFHRECIARWLEQSNLCPLCRFEMPRDSLVSHN